jgi:hypothetical protein
MHDIVREHPDNFDCGVWQHMIPAIMQMGNRKAIELRVAECVGPPEAVRSASLCAKASYRHALPPRNFVLPVAGLRCITQGDDMVAEQSLV